MIYWGISVIVVLTLLIYQDSIRIFISKAQLPERFKAYKYLSEDSMTSENYEIIKIVDGWLGSAQVDGMISLEKILYDQENNNYLIETEFKDYTQPEHRILWKVNEKGEVVDSMNIDIQYMLFNTGVYFEQDFYIDWINSGNKEKRKYASIIDGDTISESELDNHIKNARLVDVGRDFESKTVLVYLQSNAGWTRINSKKLYSQIDQEVMIGRTTFSLELSPYTDHSVERFTPLESVIRPFQKWEDSSNPLFLEAFTKESKETKPFYDVNNHGKSGWTGMGYFSLKHNSENLNFKAATFKNSDSSFGYSPNIGVYYPIDKTHDLIFINLSKINYDNRPPRTSGLYVLREKSKS